MGELWELFWPQSPLEDHQGRSSTKEVIEFEVSTNDFSNSRMLPPFSWVCSIMHGLHRAWLRKVLNHPIMALEKLSTSYTYNRCDLTALVNPTTYTELSILKVVL